MATCREWIAISLSRVREIPKDISRRELELLAESVTGQSRIEIYLEEREIDKEQGAALDKALNERLNGKPLQHLLGSVDFLGLNLLIDGRALIPRPETEWIVSRILELENRDKALNVLDIGTGSGCIALALKSMASSWQLTGVDLSEEALSLARENSERVEVEVEFVRGDMTDLHFLKSVSPFDVLVSNPPYIPLNEKAELQQEVLEHDPGMALFCEDDPMLYYRHLARIGANGLTGNGRVYMECHEDFAGEVMKIFEQKGFIELSIEKDLNLKQRLCKGIWPKK